MKSTKKKLKTGDFFAGVGGIRLGFENAGFATVYANDIDPYCKPTYEQNFPGSELHTEDITTVAKSVSENSRYLPAFDVLLAGFPCQPFSIAGHRKGFDDQDYASTIDKSKPKLKELMELVHEGGVDFKVKPVARQETDFDSILRFMEDKNLFEFWKEKNYEK